MISTLQEGQKCLSQPHVGLLMKVNAPRGEAVSAAGAALGLLAGNLLWHLKQLVLQLCGDFLEGKILNLFSALMKFGPPRWGVSCALDVLIFLLLDLEGAGCSPGSCRSWSSRLLLVVSSGS